MRFVATSRIVTGLLDRPDVSGMPAVSGRPGDAPALPYPPG